MGEMSYEFPADLRRLIEEGVADGHYENAADYVRDLVQRDRKGQLRKTDDTEPEEPPEYVAWVREQVAIGIASGVCQKNAFEVLDEIRASRAGRRG